MPHLKFLVAGGLVLGTIGYLMFSGVNDSVVYYYTVGELQTRSVELSGRGIRVSGHVAPGSIVRAESGSRVEFAVLDLGTHRELPVLYEGIIPDTFKDNAEVVVEGVYHLDRERFEAVTLLAKCPSKYEKLGEEHPADIVHSGVEN